MTGIVLNLGSPAGPLDIGSKTNEEGGTDLDLRGRGSFRSQSIPLVPSSNSGALSTQALFQHGGCRAAGITPPPHPEGATGPAPAHWGHSDLSGTYSPVPLLLGVQQETPDQIVQGHLFGPFSGLQSCQG